MRNCWVFLVILLIALFANATAGLAQSSIRLEAGNVTGSFASISGLGTTSEVVEHKIIQQGQPTVIRKIPGKLNYGLITLTRPVAQDQLLWNWRKIVESGETADLYRTATVSLRDSSNAVIASWTLIRAWPSSLKLEVRNGVLVEEVVLCCDDLSRNAP